MKQNKAKTQPSLRKGFTVVELTATLAISGILAGVSIGTYYGLRKKQTQKPAEVALVRDAFIKYESTHFTNKSQLIDEGQSFVEDYLPTQSFYDASNMKVNFAYMVQDQYVNLQKEYDTVLDSDAGILFIVEVNGKKDSFSYFLADYSGIGDISANFETMEDLYQSLEVSGYNVSNIKLQKEDSFVLDENNQVITTPVSYIDNSGNENTLLVPNGQTVLQCAYAEGNPYFFGSLETKSKNEKTANQSASLSYALSNTKFAIGAMTLDPKEPIYASAVEAASKNQSESKSVSFLNVKNKEDSHVGDLMMDDYVKVTNVFTSNDHLPINLYCTFDEAHRLVNDDINKLNSHVIYVGRNVELTGRKTYRLPENTKLLLGYDISDLTSGFEQKHVLMSENFGNFHKLPKDKTASSLSLGTGSKLIMNNQLMVASEYQSATEKDGISYGVAFGSQAKLKLVSGSEIILNRGAELDAYAPINGNGSVTAKNGSRVLDLLNIEDYLGDGVDRGISTATFYGDKSFGKTTGKIIINGLKLDFVDDLLASFPFNKISALNFNVTLNIEAGSDYALEANLFSFADQDYKEGLIKVNDLYYQERTDTFNLIGNAKKRIVSFTKSFSDANQYVERVGSDTLFSLKSGLVSFIPNNGKKTVKFIQADGHDNNLLVKPIMVRHTISSNVKVAELGKTLCLNLLDLDSTKNDGVTQTMALPMYNMDFVLDGASSLTFSNHPIKFLPGSSMTLEDNASLFVGQDIFFYKKDTFNNKDDSVSSSKIEKNDAYLDLPHHFNLKPVDGSSAAHIYGDVRIYDPTALNTSISKTDKVVNYSSDVSEVSKIINRQTKNEERDVVYESVEYEYDLIDHKLILMEKNRTRLQHQKQKQERTRDSWWSEWKDWEIKKAWYDDGKLRMDDKYPDVARHATTEQYQLEIFLDTSASSKVYGYDSYFYNWKGATFMWGVRAAYIQADSIKTNISYK